MKKIVLPLLVFLLASCGAKMKTERLSVSEGDKKAMTITDEWLITDTNMASKSIIEKILNHGRYKRYLREKGYKTPKMFVGEVENRTSEDNFPIVALNNRLLNDLFESGSVDLVSAKDREKILKEIKYQNDGMVKPSDIKSIGMASGADVMLFGEVVMEEKRLDGKTLKEYSISIRLVDIESGEEIARTLFETTKYSKRKKIGW
ncbi:MAG: penicillin-binding protein activator LpoB [Rickettsiales bacterium]|jgi:PBP1b-binding outer membrane lipoprotein LpoB|nr:penicillin-binding protein activator LpoB [Rickettsiales bacterium]